MFALVILAQNLNMGGSSGSVGPPSTVPTFFSIMEIDKTIEDTQELA